MNSSSQAEHIVVLGGGFGGWYAARALAPRLPQAKITLVDRVDHMLYTPMLTEVAGGTLLSDSIAVPVANLPKRVEFLEGEVTAIDGPAKRVTLGNGTVLEATQLVLALGSTTSYHGIAGAEKHSFPLKTLADACAVVAEVKRLVAVARACTDEARRRDLLRLVVAGGGYTGVETMAAVAEHLKREAEAAGLDPAEVEAVLIEPMGRLMLETPEDLAAYSQRQLEKEGVRILLHESVKEVQGSTVVLSDESIEAGLLLWDTGIEPSPVLKDCKLPLGKHHGVVVDSCFRVAGVEGVWAIGDCAEVPKPGGGTYSPTAQNATREGTQLAVNISAVLHGREPMPFRFHMLGQLAVLSHRTAVAEILGVHIRGVTAWLLWWAIYIVKLPSMAKRAAVLATLFGGGGGAAAPTTTPQTARAGPLPS